MKNMEHRLINLLQEVVAEWLEKVSDDVYFSDTTSVYMAEAAWSVLAAVQEDVKPPDES